MTAAARAIPACGTNAAYQRHLRLKEPVDDLCREAARAYSREYADRKRGRNSGRAPLRVVTTTEAERPPQYVRCTVCLDRTLVEYPFDDVAVRMATIRHLGDRRFASCARTLLRNAPST